MCDISHSLTNHLIYLTFVITYSSFVDVVAFAINAALAVLAHHVGGVLPTPAVYELEPKLG